MKKAIRMILMAGLLMAGTVWATVQSDTCSIGYCGVNTTTQGLWVQLTGTSQGSGIPNGTWTTCATNDAIVVNRMLSVFLLAKSMGSPVWVQGNLINSILYIDTVTIP